MQRFGAPRPVNDGVCAGLENSAAQAQEKNESTGRPEQLHRARQDQFSRAILLQIAGRWYAVETVEQALQCLREKFTAHAEPSFARAMTTYESLQAGVVSVDAFFAAFIVAAMGAGYPYEVHENNDALIERRVAIAAENALLDVLLGPKS